MDHALGPDEGAGSFVVAIDEAGDVVDQFSDTAEGCALEGCSGQDGEPDLDLVQPGGVGWGIMEVDVGVPRQPDVPFRLVGREVVEDHVDFLAGMLSYYPVHEVEELDPPAALVVPADHLAAGDIEGREQGCGPVPLVVVRLADHRPAIGQLEIALGTFQRLDRRLLIDAQDEST